jgi:hypothetical protein
MNIRFHGLNSGAEEKRYVSYPLQLHGNISIQAFIKLE